MYGIPGKVGLKDFLAPEVRHYAPLTQQPSANPRSATIMEDGFRRISSLTV